MVQSLLAALRRNGLRTALCVISLTIGVAGVQHVSPGVRTRQQLINGGSNWSATVEGVGADTARHPAGVRYAGDRVRRCDRQPLRLVSRASCGQDQSHRRVALRVAVSNWRNVHEW
jgi:hypothetical protein